MFLRRFQKRKNGKSHVYGLGTNTGLKRVSASDRDITYDDLLYMRRRFID